MSGIKTLEVIARKLIEESGIYDYNIRIVPEIIDSNSRKQKLKTTGEIIFREFVFGHSDYYGESSELLDIIYKNYPLLRNINPFIFVALHEIGHSLDDNNIFITPSLGMTKEEYRQLPREKAADLFAEEFIWKNPKQCETLSKMADKAIEEYWSELS